MAMNFTLPRAAVVAAMLCAGLAAHAQTTITITGRQDRTPSVTGFGDLAAARAPFQAGSFGNGRLDDAGVDTIGGLGRLDASVGDAYNADGYWSIVAVRGFTLDNRFNYRRDGLPINAETAIALDNKERLELLKGASGIQAGTSAPGGLVNLVVKRPVAAQREVALRWRERASVLAAADVGDRVGTDGAFGWRVNVAAEHRDPQQRDTQGRRWLGAFAADWQVGADTLIEAEIESSRQRQPSVVGFSMLGDRVPSADEVDPNLNLNRQPWNRPVEFQGNTASLRWQQRLAPDWTLQLQAMTQRLKTDDRTAFPYGDYDPLTFACTYCDRFAPDGTFAYWQYISENERRDSQAVQAALSGRARTGAVEHTIEAGLLRTRYRGRFQDQVFDIAGTGHIDGTRDTPPSAGFTDANTNRDERGTEVFARHAAQFPTATTVWAGLRHTRLQRAGVRTSPDSDGSLRATDYRQSLTTPWLALSQQLTAGTLIYASWGQGIESTVTPNRPRFTNPGRALPALKSRQTELGVKHADAAVDATLALFEISRPRAASVGTCDVDASCTLVIDGSTRHRGVDGQATWRLGTWTLQIGAMLLNAERRGSADAARNGTRPENVAERSLRMNASYRLGGIPGLELHAGLVAESDRVVLPYDESVRIPGWSRLDLGARWTQRLGTTMATWRAGVDNVTDRRAWKESPYQFDHAYLYPLAARTWRASADVAF
jgi:iron complex outermembrane receptor protein